MIFKVFKKKKLNSSTCWSKHFKKASSFKPVNWFECAVIGGEACCYQYIRCFEIEWYSKNPFLEERLCSPQHPFTQQAPTRWKVCLHTHTLSTPVTRIKQSTKVPCTVTFTEDHILYMHIFICILLFNWLYMNNIKLALHMKWLETLSISNWQHFPCVTSKHTKKTSLLK